MITKLTEAQEKMIPVYLKKWLDVGYRTSTIDREKAKDSVNFLYEMDGVRYLKVDKEVRISPPRTQGHCTYRRCLQDN